MTGEYSRNRLPNKRGVSRIKDRDRRPSPTRSDYHKSYYLPSPILSLLPYIALPSVPYSIPFTIYLMTARCDNKRRRSSNVTGEYSRNRLPNKRGVSRIKDRDRRPSPTRSDYHKSYYLPSPILSLLPYIALPSVPYSIPFTIISHDRQM